MNTMQLSTVLGITLLLILCMVADRMASKDFNGKFSLSVNAEISKDHPMHFQKKLNRN